MSDHLPVRIEPELVSGEPVPEERPLWEEVRSLDFRTGNTVNVFQVKFTDDDLKRLDDMDMYTMLLYHIDMVKAILGR